MHDIREELIIAANSPADGYRACTDDVLSLQECLTLLYISKCASAVGYRDNCGGVSASVIARMYPPWLAAIVSEFVICSKSNTAATQE